MSFSKITRVFRRTVFPTHFVTRRVQCLQSPRSGLFHLPFSRTLRSWKDVHQENEFSKNHILAEREKAKLQSKRKWTVNGTILNGMRNYVYFVDLKETNVPLLSMILRGEFVAFYGARASGKSTRVFQVMEELKSHGFVCIYISIEQINIKTEDLFWSTLGTALHISAPKYFRKGEVKSASDFLKKFKKEKWNDIKVVLFIDECDSLFEAHDDIRSSFFKTLCVIKNSKSYYSLFSSIAIGPFSILHLNTNKLTTFPFNVKKPFKNPNFTLEQVQTVYKEFENDLKITIDPEIIKDIYNRTNGHAVLVCLCGKVINSNLLLELDKNRRLDFSIWLNFVIKSMSMKIFDYSTFRRMIDTLLTKEEVRPAMKLLRSDFLGVVDFKLINNIEEIKLAEFLTAEGVLIRDEINTNSFKMSSIFIDEIIRRKVIPILYKTTVTHAVPRRFDGFLDIIDTLKIAIQYFDKKIIFNAFYRSFKTAYVYVKGQKNIPVPQESMYDTELNRILVNWIVKQVNFEVTGQWHLVDHYTNKRNKHIYSDIVIKTQKQIIVLELLATATKKELDEHFVKVLDYAEKLSANEMWIVHFTCEDYTIPYWPSDKKFEKINIMHIFHDQMFRNIRINIRSVFTSGTFNYIDDIISI